MSDNPFQRVIPSDIIETMVMYRVENKDHWISDIITPIEVHAAGFTFKPMPITGLIIFSQRYPLSMSDLDIEDHLRFIRFYRSLKSHGSVCQTDVSHFPIGTYKYIPMVWSKRIPFIFNGDKFSLLT